MAHPSSYKAILTWGKHAGSSLGSIRDRDPNYVRWMLDAEISPVWREAAARVLKDEPIDDLALPRVSSVTPTVPQNKSPHLAEVGIVLKDYQTAAVKFPYSPAHIAQIKAEIDGRKWNPDGKCWEFPVVQLPKVVTIFGGDGNVRLSADARKMLETEVTRRKELDEIRDQDTTSLTIPGLKLALYDFQRVGVEFVQRAGGRALIADACGLGKSCEAIGFALLSQSQTLIVCPKTVVMQWAEEIKKFTGKETTIWGTQEITGHGNNQFHVIGYDAVQKQLGKLLKKNFDLLVCDEATYLKNRKTLRAKALLGYYKEKNQFPGIQTKNVLFLTATPVLNRPIEAYYLLNFIDPQRFKSFFHFTQRYGGWKGEQPRNLEELHERTKDVVIRRLKKDVYSELPDKQRNDLFIDLDPLERQEYTELLNDLFRKWSFDGKATVATMPKIQGFLTEKKLKRAKELIDELLEDDRSVLVFSVYIDPLKQLAKHYGAKAELLYGDTSAVERRAIVKRLGAKETQVGCVGLKAGGMGLDGLQYAVDTVIFLNMDWVPAVHEQAEDRTHRIGQKRKVQIFYLVCEDSIDTDMRDILTEKQTVVDAVTDGQLINAARSKSYFKQFVQKISAKHGVLAGLEITE